MGNEIGNRKNRILPPMKDMQNFDDDNLWFT